VRVMQIMAGAEVGGIETFYFDAVYALADAGVEQYAVVRPNMRQSLERLRLRSIPGTIADFSSWWPWPTRRALRKSLGEFKPDIIQYWTGRAAVYAPKTNARQVGWYGGYRRRKDYRTCTDFIGITPDLMRHMYGQGIPPDHAALIHIFADPQPVSAVARDTLSTPEDAPLLLALARLHWVKGIDVLLNAMANLPDAYVWIAGEGPDRAKLETQAAHLGLKDRVRFLGWRTDRDALLAAADICVFPSRDEPFGAVIIEAWAAAKPLIAAAAQGPAQFVKSGENGILVPVDDVPALAKAIRKVIDDAAFRSTLVAGGRQSFEKSFTKETHVADTLAFYEKLIGQ
jgi:glycosyltransferase involved in cell wall biosynthesis